MKYLRNLENESDAIKKTYDVLYYIKPLGSMKIITTPRYTAIDLGLPSGLKWANMNIGAKKETDYGLYFQWGETVGYADASHSTVDTYLGGGLDPDSLAAWNTANLLDGILKPEVDAAAVNMGDSWRMPTDEECAELINNTKHEYTAINGVNGTKFINKTDASKYIFIPLAGGAANGSFAEQGQTAILWNSSIHPDDSALAYTLGIGKTECYNGTGVRIYAFSIRGVC